MTPPRCNGGARYGSWSAFNSSCRCCCRARGRDGERGRSVGRHPQRRHLLCCGVCFTGVGAGRRPPRPQTDAVALEPRHRRLHRADGRGGECLAIFCVPRADGRVRRIFQRSYRAGGEPSPGGPARLCPRLVQYRPVAPPKARGRRSILSSLSAVASTPVLLALFFVLMMAQFGMRTVQPIVTLYVQEMVGPRPDLATLSGIAFSVTGLANVIAAPFLGNRSDRIGYRRVLLICLCGATLTTLPQAFTENYWVFTAERFAVGLFIGGLLPTANALVGRLVPRAERGTIYGITASATFLGNSLGPLTGGAVAAAFGLRWVFLVTAAVLLANLLWVYYRMPEYAGRQN
ncbi:MAG: multidrug efflux MFS transporter [Alphaproteobacteria bacterium]|nr:MAG: multidrug efflux MFS transporter [Alphaproteobacteria bacterium]